jgi:hypothetical protein
MISTPDNIELKAPFGFINVNSVADTFIEITCVGENLEVKYTFDGFHGFENRSEFFDRNNGTGIELKTLPNSPYYFPISYLKYEDFKTTLSEYELLNSNENTKLWRFLSVTNFIELYSSDEPIKEIKVTEKSQTPNQS